MKSVTKEEVIQYAWKRMFRKKSGMFSRKGGICKTDVQEIMEELFFRVAQGLIKQKQFCWPGFGTFAPVQRKPRRVRNPRTGEWMLIPTRRRALFRSSQELTRKLNRDPRSEVTNEDFQ
jgi:nucleoid DNA-binding protein